MQGPTRRPRPLWRHRRRFAQLRPPRADALGVPGAYLQADMPALLLLLFVAPFFAALFGYLRYGPAGAAAGAAGALALVGLAAGLPFALLVRSARRREARREAEIARWNAQGPDRPA